MGETGIDVALRMGLHKLLAYDMGHRCRKLLDARPTCQFADVQPGKTYLYKAPYGNHMEMLTIGKITTKRTQATASVNGNGPRRIYRGSREGTFSELDADLIALADVTHETIVKAAVDAGLDVPPEVRREYPALFVEIPERFAQAHHMAAERVKNALNPTWVLREVPVGPKTLDAQIEVAHRYIAELQDTRCQAIAVNPDVAQDYDSYIAEHRADIDFYRWLRRLVDVGGVFHIPVAPNCS